MCFPLIHLIPVVAQDVVINEIMASNSGTIADEDGDFEDWIELHNPGTMAVDLAGWGLTDDSADPFRWTFPAGVSLPPGSHLLVWASGKNRHTTGLHTNFRISADGEATMLTRPGGITADMFPAVFVPSDTSFGRSPDGGGALVHFLVPTPGTANTSTGYNAPVPPPTFSHGRGIRDASFELVLTHDASLVEIWYTTDRSRPVRGSSYLYTAPIPVDSTTVVRAMAWKRGVLPVNPVATHTYIFPADVVLQPDNPEALGFPAQWGSWPHTHYGFQPEVTQNPAYAPHLINAMKAIPSLSLVIKMDDLFDPDTGIYANRTRSGDAWERPVSVEYIDPAGGPGFHADAGLRSQGGASRNDYRTPKGSLRLLFKSQYGPATLDFPLFEGSPVKSFNTLILRAEYNNEWLHPNGLGGGDQRSRGQYVRDQFIRDTQRAAHGHGSRGKHVHLYLNGLYWGVYNPSERPDAAFAASHFGGDPDDWDAMTHDGVRDGDATAWNTLNTLANADLSVPANYQAVAGMLDVPQYIDYMIVNLWAGTFDWPGNNWNAVRRRERGHGFMFFCWDAERTMESLNDNRVSVTQDAARFYSRMRANPEFRLAFADRVHRHFFHGGALTPEQAVARYQSAADAMELAVIAESARWGSYRRDKHSYLTDPSRVQAPAILYTRDIHWVAERDRLLDSYLPQRSAVVLQQFRNANLYPAVAAPVFHRHGGTLAPGEPITLSAAAGTIRYTLDGSDPRDSSSSIYIAPISLAGPAMIKARAFHNGQWSALLKADFVPADTIPEFHPAVSTDWTVAGNWNTPYYPDGAGNPARVFAPVAGDRNINLYAPVTIGTILFDEGESPYRDRVRDRSTGNTLTFDGGAGDARIEVTGTGTGFVEFEFDSECILASDLVLDVRNTAGDPEHGALRLRTRWSGPGGLIKRGAGVASLTGENKLFSGPLVIESGVLQITGPATPANTAGVTVHDGGQLRLISSGTFSAPTIHAVGGAITLAGNGRTGVPDGEGFGVLGALRYEPDTSGSRAVLTNPVHLAAPTTIHVANANNRLDLSGPLSGSHALAKSGGGTLALGGNTTHFNGDLDIANGTVAIHHNIMIGEVTGQGMLFIDTAHLTVESLHGVNVRMVFTATEAAENPALTANAASPGTLWIHLDGAPPSMGSRIQGGFILPPGSHWSQVLDDVRVLVPDISGEHAFDRRNWAIHPSAGVTRMPVTTGGQSAEILVIRIGGGPLNFDSWRTAAFPLPADLEDPAVSGLMAMPFGDGIPNLLRFALGVSGGDPISHALPRLTSDIPPAFQFPYDPGLTGLVWTVQATNDLSDWSQADILFSSAASPILPDPDGMMTISDPYMGNERRFYRLAISACAP